MVRVVDVSKEFVDAGDPMRVLDRVGFDLVRGETTSLVGVSGSGKSTLLDLIAGLMLPDSGRILFDGADIAALDDRARAELRGRRVGVVSQRGNLIPFLTASENVELAVQLAGRKRRTARVSALLGELGVSDRADHLPRHLSGGEAQRVALAVALVNDPELLLADEMTGELDSATSAKVMGIVLREWRERGLTVLFVTHNDELAACAQNRLVLAGGEVRAA